MKETKEINVKIEEVSRLTQISENQFEFKWTPALCLLSTNPLGLVLPKDGFKLFNPSAIELLEQIKVGDTIRATVDYSYKNTGEVVTQMNLVEPYLLPNGTEYKFVVKAALDVVVIAAGVVEE